MKSTDLSGRVSLITGAAGNLGQRVPDRSADEIATGIPVTYVPARNTIFLSYALAFAEVRGAQQRWPVRDRDVGLPDEPVRRQPQPQVDHGGVARHRDEADILG